MRIKRFEDISKAGFQDVYDHAGRTRAAIRGFIKYLLAYKQRRSKKDSNYSAR